MIKIVLLYCLICYLQTSLGHVSSRKTTEETPAKDNNQNKHIESKLKENVSTSDVKENNDEHNKMDEKKEINGRLQNEKVKINVADKLENVNSKSIDGKVNSSKTINEETNGKKLDNEIINGINKSIVTKSDQNGAGKNGEMNVDMGDELEAILHNGKHHVHEGDGGKNGGSNDGEVGDVDMAEELEAMLHGGEKHIHSGKHRSFIPENSTSLYGTADQKGLLHGGDQEVHSSHNIKEEQPSKEQIIGSADPEMALHEGKHHEEEEHKEEHKDDDADSDLSTELEGILHGDNGHAHDKPAKEEAGDGRKFVANDPDHLLHGEEGVHEDGRMEEVEEDDLRSRNLQFSPENVDGEVGSITREDFLDFQEWRKNKNVGKKNWMSGFSYISESFKHNLDAIKKRYLSGIFSNTNSSDHSLNIHDEA